MIILERTEKFGVSDTSTHREIFFTVPENAKMRAERGARGKPEGAYKKYVTESCRSATKLCEVYNLFNLFF